MEAKPPQEIDSSTAVLFLGSGFSQGARNIKGDPMPTGAVLKAELAQALEVDPANYDLKTLADEFTSSQHRSLYQTLYRMFTAKELATDQTAILRRGWLRVYTTNYDDVVEHCYNSIRNSAASYSYDDRKPKRLDKGAVIHLHGAIRKTTEDNVLQQLILNENSYIRQHFEKSPWYDDFIRDLRFCSSCYFIGYSLADYHISALLIQYPALREKTYFVTGLTPDRIFASRVSAYGSILPISVSGFAELCRTLPEPKAPVGPHSIRGFRYLDPFIDKKTLSPPTPIEVLNLVSFGTFNYQRCLATLPEAEYVVPRRTLIDEAFDQLNQSRCLLVHSRIGNGKSIFLYILSHKLAENGYQCFFCRSDAPPLQQDVELLGKIPKPAIFFDSYNAALDVIDQLSGLSHSAKFIVSIRTGVHDVRLHEITDRLPTPLGRVSLNGIRREDRDAFKKLLDRSGIRTANLSQTIENCKDFREIVLSLYDNVEIKKKIQTELHPLLADPHFKTAFICSNLLKWMGHEVGGAAFLRSVTGRDAYSEIAKFREVAGDIFQFDDDNVQVRSSIFSEYLIQNHFTSSDILDCAYLIIVEAVKRKRERGYQAITSSMMQVGNLKRALHKYANHEFELTNLFDRLHRDIDVNAEPLFWLQYSILMVAVVNDLPAAESFLETAYSRAAASKGFLPFQLDTHALRLFLLIEERSPNGSHVARFQAIIEKIDIVLSMIGDASHRYYAIRVLGGIESFVNARLGDLSKEETNALVFQLGRLLASLDKLGADAKEETASETAKGSLMRAKDLIVRYRE
jgi:hypothetical protein